MTAVLGLLFINICSLTLSLTQPVLQADEDCSTGKRLLASD